MVYKPDSIEEQARKKVEKGRAIITLDYAYFGSLVLKLKPVCDPTCETMWTDGARMGYNPQFTVDLPLDQLIGVMCHETMHCACGHMSRRGEREHKKWNMSADFAINQILIDCGMALPDGVLLNDGYKDMSAEEIYPLIPDPPKDKGGWGSAKADPGGTGEVRDFPGDEGKGDDKGNGRGKVPATQDQKAQAEIDWQIAASNAAQAGRSQGNMPGSLERFIGELLDPKVPWQELLRQFVEKVTKNDYSWKFPNRRFIQAGIYIPCLWSEEVGHIVVTIDTSGSISKADLDQFASELTAILEEYPPEKLTVLYCDTRIANVQEFTKEDLPLQLEAKGYGGTDFRPPFKWLEEQGIDPVCFIYLTDMECSSFPDEVPDYPVLWVATQEVSSYYGEPPFGEVVSM